MRNVFLVAAVLLLIPVLASADPLTKEELFDLYANTVDPTTIGQRLDQLFTNLPDGAFKDTAKVALKQDLLDALGASITAAEAAVVRANVDKLAIINRVAAQQSVLDALITEQQAEVIAPIEQLQIDVGDTDLEVTE